MNLARHDIDEILRDLESALDLATQRDRALTYTQHTQIFFDLKMAEPDIEYVAAELARIRTLYRLF